MEDVQEKIKSLLNNAPTDTRTVIGRIFGIEKSKLYMSTPHGIVDEIVEAIKEAVR